MNNEFIQGEVIGSGSFGDVYECIQVKTGKKFAIKKFKAKYASRKKAFEQREIQILRRFDEREMRMSVREKSGT